MNAGKKIIDTDDIYQDAKNLIEDIISSFQEQLARIYATDSINHNNELSLKLNAAIDTAITKHQNMFQDDPTQATKGVVGNVVGSVLGGTSVFGIVGLAGAVNAGTNMAMGAYKNAEALDRIGKDTRESISSISGNFAYSHDAIFKLKLESNYRQEAEYLYTVMGRSYKNCMQVDAISAKNDFKGYDIKAVCDEVAGLLKQNDFSGLKNYFTEQVADLVKNIQKYEILKPATDLAAAEVSNRHVSDFIDKTLKEAFANAEKVETSDTRKTRTTLDPDEILKKSGFGSKKATSKPEEELEQVFEGIVDDFIYEEDLPPLDGQDSQKSGTDSKQVRSLKALAQKLQDLKDSYDYYAKEYPTLSEYGLSGLSIATQTLMGFAVTLNPLGALAGFANGIRGEATGSAINAVAGEQIGTGIEATIDFGAGKLQAQYPDLTQDEARILTAGSMMGAASVVDGSAGIKQVFKVLDAKKLSRIDSDYTGLNKINADIHKQYKVEDLPWADDYNDWLKTVDPTKIQRHHVFSNKNAAIKDAKLFKDGLLDEKILNDPRNIMPLPKESGLHPTMNTHSGRHTIEHNQKMIANLDRIYKDYKNKIITKDQIEARYWKEVNLEKNSLYNGKSDLYKNLNNKR